MEAAGLLEKVEPHRHVVPYGDRGGVPIEPYLTDQWFVDAATLAKPAIEAVEQGRTRFVPENWTKTYFEWMRSEEHTSELQSLMRISYAVFCLQKKNKL